ncbi:MAG: 50S ribosomal protein L20 [Candidatus Portnoybacteria bacterium RBG_13_40_8]|uniref:Large ribosomal subunit protein bL20 n=1 Tax=Candidatus Portnoybacteria bacterium RBG_13_40_8 TaxID=1801990 RepID=A0A1G2F4C8_9BACT|nr:MAG: 50S ribosomal protein L20 [Candidatus Portnoybacteria bacterium RBG_13_40_8]OGZ34676.1 MAG: 50S ribosomal protein L20 [Candidatus Portnoybacteria bacterium RIFCSPHIGHO2_01_FULL_39_19]
MTRVKRGVQKRKRRKKVIKQAKGFKWGRKAKYRLAKDALRHAWTYAYRDRRAKKREFRQLWNIKINAICRENGISYSRFINAIKKEGIIIDRKILAELAEFNPDIFKKIIENVKK